MSNLFSRSRRWLYPLLSGVLTLCLVVGSSQVAQSLPWLDLIFQGVQVVQLSNMSDRQEVQIGKQINRQLVSRDVRLYRNSAITSYVEEIGQRLEQQSKRPNIPYTFQVVDDDKVNAFATMGGFVYIHKGLIAAADNEAELASVMSHEIAHITARHALQQMRQAAVARGLATAAGLNSNTLVNIGVELALQRPNSRKDEFQADQLGLETLKKAGYAPSGMVEFMKKLLNKGGSVPTFLSTHPGTSERIEALNQAIAPTQANIGTGLDNVAYKNRIRTLLRS
ncbi:MAG: M48 family metallopeptidase [Coleofasciculaceae cyanobacterium]